MTVFIEWTYSGFQESPLVELNCTAEELAEAREKFGEESEEYGLWVQNVASGVAHAQAMEWAAQEAGE